MIFLEIQRGKVEMPKWSERHWELGATTPCILRATTTMANCSQKKQLHRWNLILGDSWFSSVKTVEVIHESGHKWIGVVKTLHSLLPKQDLNNALKTCWPGRTNLAMEATITKGVQLIAMGYKYNSSKVLCFVVTINTESTVPGNPYRADLNLLSMVKWHWQAQPGTAVWAMTGKALEDTKCMVLSCHNNNWNYCYGCMEGLQACL